MLEKHINKITKCTDGEYRKLKRFDDNFVWYAVPITECDWINLSRTYREPMEQKILNGQIVERVEV